MIYNDIVNEAVRQGEKVLGGPGMVERAAFIAAMQVWKAMDPAEHIAAINREFARMPFVGGTASLTTMDLDDVVANLATLVGILRDVGERYNEMERELSELRTQRNAVRDFLGVGQ
jgi:hypothetical protein